MPLMAKVLSAFAILAVLVSLAAYAAWTWLDHRIHRAGPGAQAGVIEVERGESLAGVAGRLEDDGLLADARLMRLKARLDGTTRDIKAGEYRIPAGASAARILEILVSGDVVEYRVTIPEGLTTAQILARIKSEPRLNGPLPEAPPEGALLPDTYLFPSGTRRADLVARMAKAQDTLLDRLWPERAEGVPVKTREDAIILASIVEKETGADGERGLVAGVFTNRLERGMALQSDPTVIYGVSRGEPLYNRRGERRTLYRSELERETPWNTYKIAGLPKTAICNPGREAIAAVLDPPDTDYLFFVADGTGGHAFSKTLAEHNRKVADYRRYEAREIERERSEQ